MFYSKMITSLMPSFRCIAPLLLVTAFCYVGAAQEQETASGSVMLPPEEFARHRKESREERIAELEKQLFGNRRPTEDMVKRELEILFEIPSKHREGSQWTERFKDADELQTLFRQKRDDRIAELFSEFGFDKAENPYSAAKLFLDYMNYSVRDDFGKELPRNKWTPVAESLKNHAGIAKIEQLIRLLEETGRTG